MMEMKKGDLAFFYHSNEGKEIVGIVEMIREHYPDPTDEDRQIWFASISAVKPLKKPVTLDAIKAERNCRHGVVAVVPSLSAARDSLDNGRSYARWAGSEARVAPSPHAFISAATYFACAQSMSAINARDVPTKVLNLRNLSPLPPEAHNPVQQD